MAESQEMCIRLPLDLIMKSPGLGLDFGGSTLKIAYRERRCFRNGEPTSTQAEPTLHLAIFPTLNVEGNLRFIGENVDVTRNEKGEANIVCTGIRGPSYIKRLKEEFNINVQVSHENDSFAVAFKVLSAHLKETDFLHPLPKEAVEKGKKARRSVEAWMERTKDKLGDCELGNSLSGEHWEKEINMLPCLIVCGGSAFFFFKINSSGSHTMVDGIYPGGATFMGIAQGLTQPQEFDRVLEQVSSTDGRSVDIHFADLIAPPPGEEYPIYSFDGIEMNVFPFGKVDWTKPENHLQKDALYSLFNIYCFHLAHLARLNARIAKVRRIYFCGNFIDSEVARVNIVSAFQANFVHAFNPMMGAEEDYQFPKHGGYYGAIGAFLQGN